MTSKSKTLVVIYLDARVRLYNAEKPAELFCMQIVRLFNFITRNNTDITNIIVTISVRIKNIQPQK